jgi:membrane protease YdiL (CAAX protease family)
MDASGQLFLDGLLSFVLQLAAFCLIPFLVYVVAKRRVGGFWHWIGVRRAPRRAVVLAAVIAVLGAVAGVGLMRPMLDDEGSVSGRLLVHYEEHGWSVWLLGALLAKAWLQTSLTEELFFRGFVAARLIARFGFQVGNLVQALLFAALHVVFVFALPPEDRTALLATALFLLPGLAGWLGGYLNERRGDGSILPSWVMHGLGNTIAYAFPFVAA